MDDGRLGGPFETESSEAAAAGGAPPRDTLLAAVLVALLCPPAPLEASPAGCDRPNAARHPQQQTHTLVVDPALPGLPPSTESSSKQTDGQVASLSPPHTGALTHKVRPGSALKKLSRPASFQPALGNTAVAAAVATGSLAHLDPPQLPLTPVSARTLQSEPLCSILTALKDIFSCTQTELSAFITSVTESHEPDTLLRDLETNRVFLAHDAAGPLYPTDFTHQNDYNAWKAGEIASIDRISVTWHATSSPSSVSQAQLSPRSSAPVALPSRPSSASVISLTVIGADDLLPKDKLLKISNNPYCAVYFQGRSFVSRVAERTIAPEWHLQISLIVMPSDGPAVLSIWNRPTPPTEGRRQSQLTVRPKQAFLGACILPVSKLMEWARSGQQMQSVDLEKRTSKSNVRGSVSLSVRPILLRSETESNSVGGATISADAINLAFRALPSNPLVFYSEMLRLAAEHDIALKDGNELADPTRMLLRHVALAWRIPPVFQSICTFETLTRLYARGFIGPDILYRDGFSCAFREVAKHSGMLTKRDHSSFKQTVNVLTELLESQLATFFNTVHSPSANNVGSTSQSGINRGAAAGNGALLKSRSPKHLEIITAMISALQTSKMPSDIDAFSTNEPAASVANYATNLLLRSLNARYHGLLAIAHAQETDQGVVDPLIRLVHLVRVEIESYNNTYDILLFGQVHIPTLGACALYEPVATQLEDFAKTYTATAPDITNVFDLYAAVRKLQRTCESIDFRLSDNFPMTRWFKPFVCEWLTRSDTKIREWTKTALNLDDMQRLSPTIFHSSSILDIFTSFQQQIDFVQSLHWPNKLESRLFFVRLLQGVCGGLTQYVTMTRQRVLGEFEGLLRNQPAGRVTRTARIGKIRVKFKMPAMRRGKLAIVSGTTSQPATGHVDGNRSGQNGPPIQSTHRFSPFSCVRLCNIQALFPRFRELLDTIPKPNEPGEHAASPAITAAASDSLFHGDQRYTVRLSILHGQNFTPTRPWVNQLSCRVTSGTGRELGRTRQVPQTTAPIWNERVYAVLTEKEIKGGLHFSLIHHVPNGLPIGTGTENMVLIGGGTTAAVGGGSNGNGESHVTSNSSTRENSSSTRPSRNGVAASLATDHYTEFLFSTGQLHMEGLRVVMNMPDGLETLIQFGTYGKLRVHVSVSHTDDVEFLESMVEWLVESSTDQLIECFVNQLCCDLRERIHPISLKYKSQGLATLMNKNKALFSAATAGLKSGSGTSAGSGVDAIGGGGGFGISSNDSDAIEMELDPFFDFLNANLEILTENVEEQLAFRIIEQIWNRVVAIADAMILPSLGDDIKERKPWDTRRLSFFRKFVESTETFFQGDGEGLPDAAIQTRAYRQLQFALASYDFSKQALLDTYMQYQSQLVGQDRKTSLSVPQKQSGLAFLGAHFRPLSRRSASPSNQQPPESTRVSVTDAETTSTRSRSPSQQVAPISDLPHTPISINHKSASTSPTIEPSDLDWILKLLKMRGARDFVDAELRARASA